MQGKRRAQDRRNAVMVTGGPRLQLKAMRLDFHVDQRSLAQRSDQDTLLDIYVSTSVLWFVSFLEHVG